MACQQQCVSDNLQGQLKFQKGTNDLLILIDKGQQPADDLITVFSGVSTYSTEADLSLCQLHENHHRNIRTTKIWDC